MLHSYTVPSLGGTELASAAVAGTSSSAPEELVKLERRGAELQRCPTMGLVIGAARKKMAEDGQLGFCVVHAVCKKLHRRS